MDKAAYMKQLGKLLHENYPQQQADDIFADYEDFFASGLAAGKSEQELIAEFGPPEQAVRELNDERNGSRTSDRKAVSAVCVVLAVMLLALAALFGMPGVFVLSAGFVNPVFVAEYRPANFWLDFLFPLALEGILALRLRFGAPPKPGMDWVPRAQIILAIPAAAGFGWLIWYSFHCAEESAGQNGVLIALQRADWSGKLFIGCSLLLVASAALFLFSAIRGHGGARWFLFLDTTLLTFLAGLGAMLSNISETYDPARDIAACLLWSALPNLLAAGVFLAVLKVCEKRRAAAWTDR